MIGEIALAIFVGSAAWTLWSLDRRLTALEELVDKLHPEAGWVDAGGDWPIPEGGYSPIGVNWEAEEKDGVITWKPPVYTPGPSATKPEPPQGGSGVVPWTPPAGASMEP